MANVYVKGTIAGASNNRDYNFLVVEGSSQIGLPPSDIASLGLKDSKFVDASRSGNKIYQASASFDQGYIELEVFAAKTPSVGSEALTALGYLIDLEAGNVHSPPHPVKIYRGLMPSLLDVEDTQSKP